MGYTIKLHIFDSALLKATCCIYVESFITLYPIGRPVKITVMLYRVEDLIELLLHYILSYGETYYLVIRATITLYPIGGPVRATITLYPIGRPVRATITLYPIGRPVRATITLYPIGRPVRATIACNI